MGLLGGSLQVPGGDPDIVHLAPGFDSAHLFLKVWLGVYKIFQKFVRVHVYLHDNLYIGLLLPGRQTYIIFI